MKILKKNSTEIAPVVFEIVRHSFTASYDYIPDNLEIVADYIKDSDVYVVYDEDLAVAYYVLKTLSPDKKELKSMGVLEDFQNKGIGKFMLNNIFETSKGSSIELLTPTKNKRALMLYLNNDFEIVGWEKDYFGDGQPRLRLLRSK